MSNHTPGPLTVRIDDDWPFKIRTLDKHGKCVFSRNMPCYSTRQTKKEHVLSGKYMEDQVEAAAAVERAIADEVLRAAAPELFEFAQEVRRSGDTRLASMAIAVIAKTIGEQVCH